MHLPHLSLPSGSAARHFGQVGLSAIFTHGIVENSCHDSFAFALLAYVCHFNPQNGIHKRSVFSVGWRLNALKVQVLRYLALQGDMTLMEMAGNRARHSKYLRAVEGRLRKKNGMRYEGLRQDGYVKIIREKQIPRNPKAQVYRITEKGVLAVLPRIDEPELRKFVRSVADKNPFLGFAKELLDAGVQWGFVRKWLVEIIKETVSRDTVKPSMSEGVRNDVIRSLLMELFPRPGTEEHERLDTITRRPATNRHARVSMLDWILSNIEDLGYVDDLEGKRQDLPPPLLPIHFDVLEQMFQKRSVASVVKLAQVMTGKAEVSDSDYKMFTGITEDLIKYGWVKRRNGAIESTEEGQNWVLENRIKRKAIEKWIAKRKKSSRTE